MSESDKPPAGSFLSRWSQRKVETKNEPARPSNADQTKPSIGAPPGAKMPEIPPPEPTLPAEPQANQELPVIDGLTHESDFSPFMAREVDPGLRNQAMKKLFTDPHYQFGQMDKLDIYIDDYSKPDPIPLEMLRRMNQAKSLFLFDDEAKDSQKLPDAPIGHAGGAPPLAPDPIGAEDADVPAPEPVASFARGGAAAATAAVADNAPKLDVELATKSTAGKAA